MSSDLVSVEILPDVGARVWTLLDRKCNRQWLWHNDRLPLQPSSLGDGYDDRWVGGWEELFPNDAAGLFEGRTLPDHGEWWSAQWAWDVVDAGSDRARLKLTHEGLITRTTCEKWITLEGDSASVHIDYRIVSQSDQMLHFLLKQHLAAAVEPGDVIELPGGAVSGVDPAFSTRLDGPGPFEWPASGHVSNGGTLSVCPPPGQSHREFVYVSDPPEGWCGVRDPRTGASLRLTYSREVFPYTWMFMDFGGWRGHYVVVLEPCTNMPKDLDEALRLSRCASLQPGAELECSVSIHLE